jgi:hypothetical protein
MMPSIPLEDTIATLCQLHPLPSNHVFPLVFNYQPKHTFVLNRILFTYALTTIPHLSLGGLSGMVYEHILGCFIPEVPSLGFLKLFQAFVVAHGDIFKLVALMLGANRLLLMAKNTKGFCLIVVGKVCFQLINHSIVLQF